MTTYTVTDRMNKISKTYFTSYHAEQMARALNMNEGTHYRMYHGVERFTVVSA